MKARVLFLSWLTFLAGCSAYEKNEADAHITQLADGSFEIEVRFHGRAHNPHNLSPFPARYRGANWFYLKSITGTVPATEVIVTSERARLSGYAADRFQKGAVSFSGGTMTVELEAGRYRSIGHNGQYRLEHVGAQKPNKAPEPTPGLVTPRAPSSTSK